MIAIGIAVLASALLVSAGVFTVLDHESLWNLGFAVAVVTPLAAGLLVALKRPDNRIGWFLLTDALVVATNAPLKAYAHYGLIAHPGSVPGARFALLFDTADWPLLFAPLVAVVLVFPDGRLPSPRWRRVVYPAIVSALVVLLAVNLEPQNYPKPYHHFANPLPSLPAAVRVALIPFWLGAFATVFAAAWAIRVRFKRATGVERLQLLWLTYGALLIPLTIVVCVSEVAFGGRVGVATAVTFGAALVAIPVWVAIAILRHRLLDIEVVISRTLVYAGLTALLAGGYLVVFLLVDRLVSSTGVSGVAAAGVVAIGFQPARAQIQRRVEQLIYGDRADPYAALARLGRRLDGLAAPEAVFSTIVTDLTAALKLGYCAIAVARGAARHVVADAGVPRDHDRVTLPLTYGNVELGELIAEPAGREHLSPTERRLLTDLAQQAGVAVHRVALLDELQRSRQELVTAREEERLRLRRDLHDGLGPSLAALILKVGRVRERVKDDETATALLAEVADETRTALGDIRTLVYALRPPSLDELGLVGALREQAADLTRTSGVQVTLDAGELPELPAAVEVAVYRIALEAVTNTVKHARASRCRIELHLADRLSLTITDDGTGVRDASRAGVGLQSMHERATELGGTFSLEPGPGSGCSIRVVLPLAA